MSLTLQLLLLRKLGRLKFHRPSTLPYGCRPGKGTLLALCTYPNLIIRRHKFVPLYPLRKLLLPQLRRMRPGLQRILFPDRGREAARPAFTRVVFDYILDGFSVD